MGLGLGLLLTAGSAAAETSWARSGKGFEGTFTVRVRQSGEGTSAPDQYTSKWSVSSEVSGRLRLDRWDEDREAWTGTVEGTASFTNDFKGTIPGCVVTQTVKGTKALESRSEGEPSQPLLYLRGDGTYILQVNYASLPIYSSTTGVCDYGSDTTVMDVPESWFPDVYGSPHHPRIPDSPGALRFSGTIPDSTSVHWILLVNEKGELVTELPAEVTWNLNPIGQQDEAEVVISDNFEAFRPRGMVGGGRGETVTLTATLRNRNGGELREKAAKFRWAFTQVSREPGYALNAPVSDPGTEPDLRFEPGAKLIVSGAEGQGAETPEGEYTESQAVVGSYDWGAYGAVRVTAVMRDGREITGYLEGDRSQTNIRLPKRADGDLIAMNWRVSRNVGDKSDHADDEEKPVGDGNAGDGLTLYEEYRGFLENGMHIEGDPFRKDYFVLNLAGGTLTPGIRLFGKLTGLAVHDRFTPGELNRNRIINANHSSSHRVDQHAVRVVPDSTIQGYAEARGGPGTPGMITGDIALPSFTGTESAEEIGYMNSSLVHELLHSVNVYHHGEALELHVTWSGNPASGYQETSGGVTRPIRILREDGSGYDRDLGTGRSFIVGQYNSPYSGDDTCIMRYDAARGYKSVADADVRYRVDETTGTMLCSGTAGTGVNAAGRQPQARFGDAAPNRGNCQGQILVNDGVKAPRR